jgi:hypothetical protein
MTETVRPRRTPKIGVVVRHWREHAPATFPDIKAAYIGWGEPFCFRCGWLAPRPEILSQVTVDALWATAHGWLQLAHLHDHAAGGGEHPGNLVPLCELCHRAMPEFPAGTDRAIEWIRVGQPSSCTQWWQIASDARWGDDRFIAYPGWQVMYAFRVRAEETFNKYLTMPAD